jgi:hypothetical protein
MTEKLWQPYGLYELRQEDVDWAKLEAAGGVTLSDENRGHLLLAINRYRERSEGQTAAVRPGVVRTELENTVSALEKAATALSLDGQSGDEGRARTAAVRELQRAAALKHKSYAGTSKLEELRGELRKLADSGREAIGSLPRDIGREGNSHIIDGLLVSAQLVYAAAGGKGSYTELAERFRRCVAKVAGFRSASDGSLRHRFTKAWSKVRENPPTKTQRTG